MGAGIGGDNFSFVEGAGTCPFTLSTTDTNAVITVSENGTQWNLDSDQRNLQWDATPGTTNQYLNKYLDGIFYAIKNLAEYTYTPNEGYDDILASVVEDGEYPVTAVAGEFNTMVFNQQRYYEYEFDYARGLVEQYTDARPTGFFFFQSSNMQLDDAYEYLGNNGWTYSVSQYIDTETAMKGLDQTYAFATANPLSTHKSFLLTESDSAFRGPDYLGNDDASDLALVKRGLRKVAAYAIANESYLPIQLTHWDRAQRTPDKAKWTSEALNALMEESNSASSLQWLTVEEALDLVVVPGTPQWEQVSSVGAGAFLQAQGTTNIQVKYSASKPTDGEDSFTLGNKSFQFPGVSGMSLWVIAAENGTYSSKETT